MRFRVFSDLRLLFTGVIVTLKRVFFGEMFSEALDQNTLHYLFEKRYCSIVRITSVSYVQAEDCNTHLHETLSTW